MQMFPSVAEIANAVRQYNLRFGDQDRQIVDLTKAIRDSADDSRREERLEVFVRGVQRWGRIQGVYPSDPPLMARALADSAMAFDCPYDEIFDERAQETTIELVAGLVASARQLGVRNRHWSWASKLLHWLAPTRVPVYDSFLRKHVEVANKEGEVAYRAIIAWEYGVAQELAGNSASIVGEIEPRTLIRAIDKYAWWISGGNVSKG